MKWQTFKFTGFKIRFNIRFQSLTGVKADFVESSSGR